MLTSTSLPLLVADVSSEAGIPAIRFFGAFLGMVIGGLITAKMPAFVLKKEPYVFMFMGGFFGFVLAEALLGLLFFLLIGCCFYALHRSWDDIEPTIQALLAGLRGENPTVTVEPAPRRLSPQPNDQSTFEDALKRREAAAYAQIVAAVEEQAQRFDYPEELRQREIEHRFRMWKQQQCQ